MNTHGDGTDDTVFIPPLELRGSRAARLRQLERQMANLRAIHQTLVVGDVSPVAHAHARHIDASPGSWFVAGAATVLVLALLTLGGWVTRSEVTVAASPVADVVRATR